MSLVEHFLKEFDVTKDEWDEYVDFLEELRESGVTNMFGAGVYLEKNFGIDKALASKILVTWRESYSETS